MLLLVKVVFCFLIQLVSALPFPSPQGIEGVLEKSAKESLVNSASAFQEAFAHLGQAFQTAGKQAGRAVGFGASTTTANKAEQVAGEQVAAISEQVAHNVEGSTTAEAAVSAAASEAGKPTWKQWGQGVATSAQEKSAQMAAATKAKAIQLAAATKAKAAQLAAATREKLAALKAYLASLPSKISAAATSAKNAISTAATNAKTAISTAATNAKTAITAVPGKVSSAATTAKTAISQRIQSGLLATKQAQDRFINGLKVIRAGVVEGFQVMGGKPPANQS